MTIEFNRGTVAQLKTGLTKARKGEMVFYPGVVMVPRAEYDKLVSQSATEVLTGLTPPVNKDGSLSKRLVYIGKNTERANEIRAIQNDSNLLHEKDVKLLKGIIEFLDKDGWLSQKQIDAIATLEYGIEQNKQPEYYPAGMDNYGSLP